MYIQAFRLFFRMDMTVILISDQVYLSNTVHGNYLVGEDWQIWRIVSYLPNFFSPIFTDTPKMYMAYALTVAYLPNFSSPITFICTVRQNFPRQIFPCTVAELAL